MFSVKIAHNLLSRRLSRGWHAAGVCNGPSCTRASLLVVYMCQLSVRNTVDFANVIPVVILAVSVIQQPGVCLSVCLVSQILHY